MRAKISIKPYYRSKNLDFTLAKGNCLDLLPNINFQFDMIFADPPYFLSNGGFSVQSGKQVSVNKGEWDKSITVEEKIKFNRKWIKLCRNILKDNGTIWISGTLHNIHTIGVALEMEGFSIINDVVWQKPNPVPNLSCRSFTHSYEIILWARKQITTKKKGKHYFDYNLMKAINGGKQMKDIWLLSLPKKKEKICGYHPTQKPLSLLERIILASTKPEDLILDPFSGSGTTGIAAIKLGRKYIGIELDQNYLEISKLRCEKEINNNEDSN